MEIKARVFLVLLAIGLIAFLALSRSPQSLGGGMDNEKLAALRQRVEQLETELVEVKHRLNSGTSRDATEKAPHESQPQQNKDHDEDKSNNKDHDNHHHMDSADPVPNVNIQPTFNGGLIGNDVAVKKIVSDDFYTKLLASKEQSQRAALKVVEVGVFDGAQATEAVSAGYSLLALEPSAKNFARANRRVGRYCKTHACHKDVQIMNVAASSHHHTVTFLSKGGSGDHVVTDGKKALGEAGIYTGKGVKRLQVPAIPIDSKLGNLSQSSIYILKIDVQDHEPLVLKGTKETIRRQVPDFILIEYRPQGWEHMNKGCNASATLSQVCDHYDCYFMGKMQRRNWTDLSYQFAEDWVVPEVPKITSSQLTARIDRASDELKTIDDFGAWTDLVAVAPRDSARDVWSQVTKQAHRKL